MYMYHMSKRKLNKRQEELLEEMTMELKDLEKEDETIPDGMARLDGPLMKKRKETEKKYLKLLREASDQHSE